MYKIYADNLLIYDDTSSDPYVKVASPTLTMEESAAGSLKMTLPPGNAGYEAIVRMATEIMVQKDGTEIWWGRALQESKDFWNQRQITCEGALAYFNDTTQTPALYHFTGGTAVRQYLSALLTIHNAHVPSSRQFTLGAVTVTGEIDITVNYEKTMELINKLVSQFGGNMRVRKENGTMYLDYLDTEVRTTTQTIEFGKNLIDFTKSFDSADYATVVIPLGAKQEEEVIEGVDNYLTVASVNGGSIYVQASQEMIDQYGWIETVVHWDKETDPSLLLARGQSYLSDLQFDTMVLTLSALDLHYLNPSIEDVRVGDRIRVVSTPHGIDRFFPVKKLDIPLDEPQNTKFQLGDNVKVGLTSVTGKITTEVKDMIDNAVDEDAILREAQDNAAAIMNLKTNGYITITTDDNGTNELYISEVRPVKNEQGQFVAQRFWRFNMNGLGYTDDYGESWKSAILMDGSILGERIAAGSIHGSKITTGTLSLVSSAGQEACTLSLAVRGLSADQLEIGDLDASGQEVDSPYYARTIDKMYFTSGTEVKVTGYDYEVFRYSNNTTPTSGFVQRYQLSAGQTFTIPANAQYRFVISNRNVQLQESDLNTIGAAMDLGTATSISSAEIKINGMVTFSALSTDSGTTIINGANIRTGQVTADHINLKGITVKNANNNTTFAVDANGNVTINGAVTMGAGSSVSWNMVNNIPSTVTDAYDLADDAYDLADEASDSLGLLVNGQYYNGTFIDGQKIISPTIIGSEIVAQTSESSSDKTGSFVLKDGAGNRRCTISYTSDVSGSPHVEFATNSGTFYFTNPLEMMGGFVDTSSANNQLYGNTTVHGKMIFNAGNSGSGGKLILGYGTTFVAGVANLPPNPENGQVCFVY